MAKQKKIEDDGNELSAIKEIRAAVVHECFVRRHDGTCLRGKCLRNEQMRELCLPDESDALLTDEEMKGKAVAMGLMKLEKLPPEAKTID